MMIEFKSPRERRIFKALASYGADGASVNELRRSMKNPPLPGSVNNVLYGLLRRGLVCQLGAVAGRLRSDAHYDGPVDIWAVHSNKAQEAADVSHAAG